MTKRTPRPASAPRPVEFTAPLSIPGGGVAGAEIVRELAPELALAAWQTLRSVLMWAAEDAAARSVLFDAEAMRAWEAELLLGTWDEGLRMPLAVLVGELALGPGASPDRVARSCLCVSEWALPRNAVATTLAFAEAAALAWPEHPRYAWMAGRLLRKFGRPREAEQWIRRSIRVATALSDWETQTLAMNSLGNVLHDLGNHRAAAESLQQALKAARRYHLKDREGEIFHDLIAATADSGNLDEAEQYARNALEAYVGGHPRLAALAYDVAFLWVKRGQYSRALPVLLELSVHFDKPHDRIKLLASAAYAAAVCEDEALFESLSTQAAELAESVRDQSSNAYAYLQLGTAASRLHRWAAAESLLHRAGEVARARSESKVVIAAERALVAVTRHRVADTEGNEVDAVVRAGGQALAAQVVRSGGQALAAQFIASLKTVPQRPNETSLQRFSCLIP